MAYRLACNVTTDTTYALDEARAALASAVALHTQGDFQAAVPFYIRAVTLAPNDPEILHAAGIALGQAGKSKEAVKFLTAALEFGKNTADVWNGLAAAYTDLRKLGNAERCWRMVVRLNPKSAAGWLNYANFAYAGGDPKNGAARMDRAVGFKAHFADDGFSQAMIWLLRGQWRLGWKAYEYRRLVTNWRIRNQQNRALKAPELAKRAIKRGMRILVESEQGQGDGVMAARFIQPFAEAFGVTVVMQSHDALVDLMAGALPGIEVVGRKTIPHADGWVPLLSLPYFVGLERPRDVPAPIRPFGLWWAPRATSLTHELAHGTRKTLRVFVHARGNAVHSYDFDRSVPSDATLAPIRTMPNVEIVTAHFTPLAETDSAITQIRERGDEAPKQAFQLMQEPTWRETVDQLLTCDRCLTVDTGLAHVAGSLGIPTDLMVPTMPEFRWGLDKSTTPWYPSVKLWRRDHTDHWPDMIARIAAQYATL